MIKQIIQARIDGLEHLLAQAGRRLSAATTKAIEDVIGKLKALMAADDPSEDMAEQAFSPVGTLMVQETVTGETWAGTYEELLNALGRAVRRSGDIEGDYKWIQWTWPDKLLVYANRWDNVAGWPKWWFVDWFRQGDSITFSNVREANMAEVAYAVQQAIEDADVQPQADEPGEPAIPQATVIDEDGECYLLQQTPLSDIHVQTDGKSGRVTFSGTATVADVVNSYGQVYPSEFWQHHVQDAQTRIPKGLLVGADGHKQNARGGIRLPLAGELTHKFTSLQMDGTRVKFKAQTLGTQAGKDLAAALSDGVAMEMSTVVKAKSKKGKFQGQEVEMPQVEGSELFTIDVVMRGASPGSTIDHAKLQALKEHGKESEMTPEEIKALIQEAIAAGNAEQVAKLQAQLDELKNTLGQAPTLSEADRETLAQAQKIVDENAAVLVAKSRDKKVGEVLGQMVADKKLPDMFLASASAILRNMAQTAEEVELKLPALEEVMKPMLEQQALLQSKGLYVPEFKPDGSKIKVNTPQEAIEDLIQTRIENGKLPADTGVDDPSNLVRNVRVMLQTMAMEHPEYVVSYMRVRNGDVKSVQDMKHFLQQSYGMLLQEVPTGAMSTTDVAAAIPNLMGIVTELTPQLIANRYASIQPMSRSKGTIAYWKIYDKDDALIKAPANFTGSYANDPGEFTAVNTLHGELTTDTIEPDAKKIGYNLSIEVQRRLGTDWGIDASGVMVTECANEIAREWNYNHLAKMLQGATAGNWTYGTAKPADSSFDGEQWQKQIINYLYMVRAGIAKKTMSKTVAIVGGIDEMTRIFWLAKEMGVLSDTPGVGQIARGVNITGTLKTGEELVSVDWWEAIGFPAKLLVIGRGQEWYRSGYIVAPYLGLYVTPSWTNPSTLNVQQGMLSEVGEKMVNGDYFGTLTVAEGTAGTPL